MSLSRTIATTVAATAMIASVPAFAASEFAPEKRTKEISISGLDLSKVEHAEIALDRIKSAADKVCRTSSSNRETIRERFLQRACEQSAIKNAVEALGAPIVTELSKDS